MGSSEREEFEAELAKMPDWAPEFEQHRAWVNAYAWNIWQAARRAQASAEPVARMEVLNPGAVTYCVTAAARQLPPGDYLLYAAPQQELLTGDTVAWHNTEDGEIVPHMGIDHGPPWEPLVARGITAAKEST